MSTHPAASTHQFADDSGHGVQRFVHLLGILAAGLGEVGLAATGASGQPGHPLDDVAGQGGLDFARAFLLVFKTFYTQNTNSIY